MIKIRIGNDIPSVWKFYTKDGNTRVPYIIEGKDVRIVMTDTFGAKTEVSPTITGNSASWTFYGKDQKKLGAYTFTFFENFGAVGMKALDKIQPFRLVAEQEVVESGTVEGCCSSFEVQPLVLESELPETMSYESLTDLPKINHIILIGDKTLDELGIEAKHPYLSLERLCPYLYKVTFDSLPQDNGGDNPVIGGCSSYVANGKLYRNLDWGYDNTAEFRVITKDFEGMSFITGLNDGALDERVAQLPYRVCDGVNNYGIKVSTHVLFNDWSWTGTGDKSINITRLPFLVLSRVKSMATLAQDLNGVLDNLYAPEGLLSMGYLIQFVVTDGQTTYAIIPPTSEGESYEVMDITECPKLTNFRPVGRETVSRTDADMQDRPTGVERYNMMPCPLEDLRFTLAYEEPDRLSEFIGLRGTDKDSTDAQLEAIYDDARALYLSRERDGQTWQTMHSVVYGNKMETLYVQEDFSDNLIGDVTAERARAIAAEAELRTSINAEVTRATGAEQELAERVSDIESKEGTWDAKQEAIEDLGTIREGAAKGMTALQSVPSTYRTASSQDAIDNGMKQRLTAIEGKEAGWDAKQNAIADLDEIRSGASLGSTALQAVPDTYRTASEQDTIDNAIKGRLTTIEGKEAGWDAKADLSDIPEVVDGVTSTSTTKALSANQGKALNDRINNLLARGRFLSFWDATTGMPLTNPSGYPYEYHTGDYFIVNKVGETNYIPNGATYTGQPSTTVYTDDLKPNDSIYYDGTSWSVFDTPAGSGDIQDVYVNGVSVVVNGIAYVVTPTELKDLTGDATHRVVTDIQIAAWDAKQGVISDLQEIRSGAALGATALQSVPSTYRTASEQDVIDNGIKDRVSAIENKESGWDAKQNAISDLQDIREGAAKGATSVQDTQIDDTSIVDENGIAKIPVATSSTLGAVKVSSARGIIADSSGVLGVQRALSSEIEAKSSQYRPLVPYQVDSIVKEGLGNYDLGTDNVNAWSDAYKAHARQVLGAQNITIQILEEGDN